MAHEEHEEIDERKYRNKDGSIRLNDALKYYPKYFMLAKREKCDCQIVSMKASLSPEEIGFMLEQFMSLDEDFEGIVTASVVAHFAFHKDKAGAVALISQLAKLLN